MKKIIALALLVASSATFATQPASGQQQQQSAISGSNSDATNAGNSQTIVFEAQDNTAATREAGSADISVALINTEAAKVIAGTTQTIKNTPSVSGPNLVTSNDTCMGSTSGSLNIAGLGFGGGTSWVDTNCKMLKNSREMWNMGMKAAALALMCTDSANKEALEITGFICPQTAAKAKEDEAKALAAK
jgi:hypothetical protein